MVTLLILDVYTKRTIPLYDIGYYRHFVRPLVHIRLVSAVTIYVDITINRYLIINNIVHYRSSVIIDRSIIICIVYSVEIEHAPVVIQNGFHRQLCAVCAQNKLKTIFYFTGFKMFRQNIDRNCHIYTYLNTYIYIRVLWWFTSSYMWFTHSVPIQRNRNFSRFTVAR